MGISEKFTIHAADLSSDNSATVGRSDTTNPVADVAGPAVDRLGRPALIARSIRWLMWPHGQQMRLM